MRGTFGFVPSMDEEFQGQLLKQCAVVLHVFRTGKFTGKLLVELGDMFRAYHTVIDRDNFVPSRDAYFSKGSWVEPEWEGDSCRCTNYWATDCSLVGDKPNPNSATNVYTDKEALQIYGPFVGECQIANNLSLSEALAEVTKACIEGSFDVHVLARNGDFAGFKIVPAGQTGRI